MDTIVSFFQDFSIDFHLFWKAALILLIGTLVLSLLGRFAWGKRSVLNAAVSSVFGILFIYAISVVLRSAGMQYADWIAPLPFVTISNNAISLFSFAGAHYTVICSEILSMIILAFLVNLAEGWLPKGKNVLTWVFFRCLTVSIAYFLHLIVVGLFANLFPAGIVTYAPVILLAILIVLLLTGALKIVVGALLSTVNPIIGGLYTFFFANAIGKQITKAILTTAILTALVIGLQYVGANTIYFAVDSLPAYIPIALILVALWYLTCLIF